MSFVTSQAIALAKKRSKNSVRKMRSLVTIMESSVVSVENSIEASDKTVTGIYSNRAYSAGEHGTTAMSKKSQQELQHFYESSLQESLEVDMLLVALEEAKEKLSQLKLKLASRNDTLMNANIASAHSWKFPSKEGISANRRNEVAAQIEKFFHGLENAEHVTDAIMKLERNEVVGLLQTEHLFRKKVEDIVNQ